MINLLSDEYKSELRAARSNLIIVRYIGIVLLAALFMCGALFISYSLLEATMNSAEQRIQANDVKADVYSQTQQQVTALSAQLDQSKTILDQEVRYSQLLVKLGQIMPTGTVIGKLSLTSASFNGQATPITAYAKTASEASSLQSQLQTSPLFNKVSLTSTENSGQGIPGYPVTVELSVVFNRAGI